MYGLLTNTRCLVYTPHSQRQSTKKARKKTDLYLVYNSQEKRTTFFACAELGLADLLLNSRSQRHGLKNL
jgi:hypothetical protein